MVAGPYLHDVSRFPIACGLHQLHRRPQMRIEYTYLVPFHTCITRKRRVHYHNVKGRVRDIDVYLGGGLLTDAAVRRAGSLVLKRVSTWEGCKSSREPMLTVPSDWRP